MQQGVGHEQGRAEAIKRPSLKEIEWRRGLNRGQDDYKNFLLKDSKSHRERLGTFHSELTALFKDMYKVRYLDEDQVCFDKIHLVGT